MEYVKVIRLGRGFESSFQKVHCYSCYADLLYLDFACSVEGPQCKSSVDKLKN